MTPGENMNTKPLNSWTTRTAAARPAALACLAALGALLLSACSGSGSSDTVTVNGDVPIAYVKRSTSVGLNPTDGANSAPGGDLMVREKSSPSAPEHNVTAGITQGNGDASDPEVSYDGKKIVFALRCPSSNTSQVNGAAACTGRWNIWEYDMSALPAGTLTGGTLRRITASTSSDDVDPVYLPANRGIIFSSNRQEKSSKNQALGRAYFGADEYERERVFNLHSVATDGSNVQQISFSMSHERNPVIRPDGNVMFSRWEHVADRNRFAIFSSKPDGTNMFVLYGALSTGNSYLHPRDMDPKGAYKGQVVSTLMPLSGTQEGGAIKMIDAANYSEDNTPANKSIASQGGQSHAAKDPLNPDRLMSDGRGLSLAGRATTPYPLYDGSDRILVAYRPCEITRNGVVASCTTLTDSEKALLGDDTRTRAERALDAVQNNAPSAYAVYMFNPAKQQWLIVAAPPQGFMFTDPVALAARTEPNVVEPTSVDPALAAQNMALIEVRSVYDTDGLNRMASQMLVASDRAGCTTNIPQTGSTDPGDTRSTVADLKKMKDPADPAYNCAPARFVRASRGVPPPAGGMGARQAIGETEFEQNQILGYAPIEPDGSFKLQVPADVPLALTVVDADGRGLQTHINWIQVRPGERRTCDGCHSPRRGAALNSGAVVNTIPAAIKTAMASQHQSGETMASLRTRLDPSALALATSPVFTDVWADTAQNGVSARPAISLRYTGNPDPADDLSTPAPANGVINYPDHIQPLWTKARAGGQACVACHADTLKLDLRPTISGTGRLVSYEELLLGDPVIDPVTGRPQIRLREGVPEVVRGPALVENSSGSANSAGIARKSRLTEIMWGQTLLVSADTRTAHPNPPAGAPDHSQMLNKAEKRLLAEWMDLGGQYYNDPFDTNGGIRSVNGLSEETFLSQVQPILKAQCASCHEAGLGNPRNRFVLTGSTEGDYNVTLSLINNTCTPAANPLLKSPSTVPHPSGELTQTTALLPVGSTGYNQIAAWIARGCSTSR
jgi:mono/diheme cytochrome c family protein